MPRIRIQAAVIAVLSVCVCPLAHAELLVFFARDNSTFSYTKSEEAEAEFLSFLTDTATEDFESFAFGDQPPLSLPFAGSGSTAVLTGTAGNLIANFGFSQNAFPHSETQVLLQSPGMVGDNADDMQLEFNGPRSAVGLYVFDIGDAGDHLEMTILFADGSSQTIATPTVSGDSRGLYWGVIATTADELFTQVTLHTAVPNEGFSIDDVTTSNVLPDICAVSGYQKISDTEGGFTDPLATNDVFGYSTTAMGDVDGDGIPDIAIGSFADDGGFDRGAIWIVFLNADGTVKDQTRISDTAGGFAGTLDNGDSFGIRMTSLGDLDGDNVPDLAVGAIGDDDGGSDRGAVWILFLNSNGTVKGHQKISHTEGGFTGGLNNADSFGSALAALPDLDGDNVIELAVGAATDDDGGTNRGAVWILFLNSDGTVKSHQKVSDTTGGFAGVLDDQDRFATALATVGDLDGDGLPELAVGVESDDDGGSSRGAVWILSLATNGTVTCEKKISNTEGGFLGTLDNLDIFGRSLAALGDLDGDSIPDLGVGAHFDDDGGTDHGAVWLLFLNSDGSVKNHRKISDTTGGFGGDLDSDEFGVSTAMIGDVDGDGQSDLAVGAIKDDDGGANHGAVWILFLGDCPAARDIPPLANAGIDQSVNEGQLVTLDGSGSSDPDGDPLMYSWLQLPGGTPVTLSDANAGQPTFTAGPVPIGGETLTFELTVTANGESATDTVSITVVNVNHPPVADAGADQSVAEGSPVTLHGEDSFDIDSDTFSYVWVQVSGLPTVTLTGANTANPSLTAPVIAAGGGPSVVATLVFELMVDDGFPQDAPAPGYTFADVADSVTIEVTNVNNDPTAAAGGDQTVNENTLVSLNGTSSSDPDSDPLTFSWEQIGGASVMIANALTATPSFTAPFVSAGGEDFTFELTVDDAYGGVATDTVVVHVQNINDPPLVSAAEPTKSVLWPPNHKFVSIGIMGVSDPDDNATITITSVTQDEPTNGLGDGDTAIDAIINGDGTVFVRAERAGGGNGRVYHIHFTASDLEGSASGVVTVSVPQRKTGTAIDDGELYDSTF